MSLVVASRSDDQENRAADDALKYTTTLGPYMTTFQSRAVDDALKYTTPLEPYMVTFHSGASHSGPVTTASKSNFKSKRISNPVSAAALKGALPYHAKNPKHLPAEVSNNRNQRTHGALTAPAANPRRAGALSGTSLNGGGKGISGGDGPGQGGGDGDSDDDDENSRDNSHAVSQVTSNPTNTGPATYTYSSSRTPTSKTSTGWSRIQ